MTTHTAYAEMMAESSNTAHLWTDTRGYFAKLVVAGRTVARIDCLTDESVVATAHGVRTTMVSWESASAWLASVAVAAALTTDSFVTYEAVS